jgi:hypothetical protein
MSRSHLEMVREARGTFRRWARDAANDRPRPTNRELLQVGAVLRVQQPAALLEHLAEVARCQPEMIGLENDDEH